MTPVSWMMIVKRDQKDKRLLISFHNPNAYGISKSFQSSSIPLYYMTPFDNRNAPTDHDLPF